MDLIELQNKIHEQNKAMGWWDEPRSTSTICNLIITELSEAVEGDRKNLMDDHLNSYSMAPVEMADCAIRCFDFLGYMGNKRFDELLLKYDICEDRNFSDLVAEAQYCISTCWAERRDKNEMAYYLCRCVRICFEVIGRYELNPVDIILEKVEYNKHRADHKRENREKVGGKKY